VLKTRKIWLNSPALELLRLKREHIANGEKIPAAMLAESAKLSVMPPTQPVARNVEVGM
jgi:hypothetical protein